MRSDAHNELQDVVKGYFQAKDWIAIKEHCINGKKIDVLAQNKRTKYTVANEIQLSPKHYKENILLDFKAGCNEVRIISINKKVSDQIERRAFRELDRNLLRKVRFQVGEEYFPHVKQQQIIQNKAENNPELKTEQNTEERRE